MKDNKIGLVIGREFLTRVKKKSFIILTFLMPLLIVALIAAPLALSMIKGSEVKTIAVTDADSLYFSRLTDNELFRFVPGPADPTTAKEQSFQDETGPDAFLVLKGNLHEDSSSAVLYSAKQVDMELKTFVSGKLDSIARIDQIASFQIPGLDSIIEQADADVNLTTVKWGKDGQEKKSSSELALAIGMIATMIIYIFIFAYGGMVMNGVIEEKSNRIIEVIVSSVKPFQLMMGKIIGIALVGLTQMLLWVLLIGGILGIATFALKDGADPSELARISTQTVQVQGVSAINMPEMQPTADVPEDINQTLQEGIEMITNLNLGEIVLWFILFFLGGYLLYASLFAAIGGAIDNQEDAQQFMLPITMLVLFALYAGIYGAQNPEGPLAFWCSMIPFTSPIVMMVRLPFGVPFWQLLLSYGLLILTFIGTTKVAAKIYRTGILMYGKKVTWKELWKWLKYKN